MSVRAALAAPIPDPPNKGLVHCGPARRRRRTPLATAVMPCTPRILPANPAVQWDSNGAARSYGVRSSFPVKSVIKNKAGERHRPFRVRFDQCVGPGGVVLASCSTAVAIRRQVSAPS